MIKTTLNSKLFKSTGIYAISSVLNSAIPFLLIPILTRYLSPDEYGLVSMFMVLVSILNVFVGLNIHGAIHREFYNKSAHFKEYVGNCLFILIVSSIWSLISLYLFSELIYRYTSLTSDLYLYAVSISFFQFVILSLMSIYQAQQKALNYGLFQVGQTLFRLILSLLFVISLGLGAKGRILGDVISVFTLGVVATFILVAKYAKFRINRNYIIQALKFGLPLVPHAIGGIFVMTAGRIIINNHLGLHEVGIYTLGMQMGSLILIFADSFNKAYVPWLFNKLTNGDYNDKLRIVKFTYIYFIFIGLFAVLYGVSSPYIFKYFIGEKYLEANSIILWIAIGSAFNGMYYMVTNYIFYVYKTYLLTIVTFVSGILNIVITFFLVKNVGLLGAAYAYVTTNFFIFIFTWLVSAKVYSMPWMFWRKSVNQ